MQTTKLSEIIMLQKGKKPTSCIDIPKKGYLPYILIEQMEGHPIKQYTNDNCPVATKDDTLIVRDGAGIGKIATNMEGIIGSTICAVTPIGIKKDFLFRFLTYAKAIIRSRPKGTGLPHVDPQVFNNLQVPIYTISQQETIINEIEKQCSRLDNGLQSLENIKVDLKSYKASILKSAVEGKLTEQRRKENKNIEPASKLLEKIQSKKNELIKSKIIKKEKEMLMDNQDIVDELPSNRIYEKLGNICFRITDGFHNTPKAVESGVPYVTATHVKQGNIDFDNCLYVSENDHQDLYSKVAVKKGDILIVNIGAGSGDSALVKIDFEFSFKNVAVLKTPDDLMVPEYILYLIRANKNKLLHSNTKGGAQPFLSLEVIRNFIVSMPPLAEQKAIVQEVEEKLSVIDAVVSTIEANIKRAKQLKQSILHQAFTGQLVPMKDDDKGVTELLAGIEKTKAILVGQKKTKKAKQK